MKQKSQDRVEGYFVATPLRLRQSEQKGRYVVSNRPIKSGELVLEVPAYTIAIHSAFRKRYCIQCFRPSRDTLTISCPCCKKVFYCSEECVKKEADSKHGPTTLLHERGGLSCNVMCSMWKEEKEHEVFVTNICLLLCRRLQEENQKEEEQEKGSQRENAAQSIQSNERKRANSSTFEDVRLLVSHYSCLDEVTANISGDIARSMSKFFPDKEWDLGWLIKLISKETSNTFGILDIKGRYCGRGCFPQASYMNHSCSPNLARMLVGTTMYFYALTDIEEGTELSISYIDLNVPRSTRQTKLRQDYHFICDCPRCQEIEGAETAFIALLCTVPHCGGLLIRWDVEIIAEEGEVSIKEGKKCCRCLQTFLPVEAQATKHPGKTTKGIQAKARPKKGNRNRNRATANKNK